MTQPPAPPEAMNLMQILPFPLSAIMLSMTRTIPVEANDQILSDVVVPLVQQSAALAQVLRSAAAAEDRAENVHSLEQALIVLSEFLGTAEALLTAWHERHLDRYMAGRAQERSRVKEAVDHP